MQEILNNQGENQLIDVIRCVYRSGRSVAYPMPWTLPFTVTARLTAASRITGLKTAVPIITNTGVYGGIDRAPAANAIWRTTSWDANSAVYVDRHAG